MNKPIFVKALESEVTEKTLEILMSDFLLLTAIADFANYVKSEKLAQVVGKLNFSNQTHETFSSKQSKKFNDSKAVLDFGSLRFLTIF